MARASCSAGLASQHLDQRPAFALHQALQGGLHFGQILETVHALATAAQFARGLRAAQQQHANKGGLAAREIEDFLQAMLILRHPAVGARRSLPREALVVKDVQGLADGVFVQMHDGIAVVFLVAGIDQRVQGQRIVVGSGDVLFDQRTENASLDLTEQNVQTDGSSRSSVGPWVNGSRQIVQSGTRSRRVK